MPAQIEINGVVGSNESAVDLNGVATLTFTSAVATVVYQWEFLDWPTGSQYTNSWLGGAPGLPTAVGPFTPDMEGTWIVKLTDTNDGATDTIICGIKSRRTSLRVPGAGETTESDNTVFPLPGVATNHRGWALTRDLGLKYLDDLVTSGSVQIFYLDDPVGIPTAVNAGTPLALVQGAPTVLFPGGAPPPYANPVEVPRVQLAQADSTSTRYAYVGVLKAGRDSSVPVVSNTSYGYITSSIPTGTFVWVSTSGVIQGEAAVAGPVPPAAAATLDFSVGGWAVGNIAYLSGTTPGALVRDTDTFPVGSTASELMTPVGIVGSVNAQGHLVVLPNLYQGNPVINATTEMYRGIGDYSSLRVGRSDGVSVAGEEDGTVELCAIAGEAITTGDIVCISTNGGGVMQAFVADSSTSPDVADNKKYGIFGVAIQTVVNPNLGHFTIFGETNATLTFPATGSILYVGSSTAGLGDTSGTATIINRIDSTVPATVNGFIGDDLNYSAISIPLGIYDGAKLILGIVEDPGLQASVYSPDRVVSAGSVSTNAVANTRNLGFNRANVYRWAGLPNDWASVDLPNTESDSLMMTTSIYEDTLKGSDLYDTQFQTLGGNVWTNPPVPQVDQDMPGASLENGVWVGTTGLPPRTRNPVYGTFVLEDERYFEELIPITFEMHGYTDSHTPNQSLEVLLEARVNYKNNVTLGDFTEISDTAYFNTGNVADTNSAFSIEFFSQFSSTGDVFYVPKYDVNGNSFYSIDFLLTRLDTTDASMMIERVVLQALYLNKNVNLHEGFPPVVFEKKIPGYALIDTSTSAFNIIDDGPVPGAAYVSRPTVGASMTNVAAPGPVVRTISTLAGFIPYDTRIAGASFLFIRVQGKYMGANAAATDLELELTYEEIQTSYNYDPDITVGGTTLPVAAFTPAPTAAGDYCMATFDFAVANPKSGPSVGADGIRFLIERVSSGGGVPIPIVGENSFQISNVYVQSDLQQTYGAVEDVYEDSTTGADVVDIDNLLNIDSNVDFNGFLFPGIGGSEALYIPIKVDKRYDYRENISIEVFGYVDAANASPVVLDLGLSNFYDHEDLLPQTGAVLNVIQQSGADISVAVPGGEVKFIKHNFVLNAKDIWNFNLFSLVPNYTQFRDSGNATTLLKITRNDANTVPFAVMGVRVYTSQGKRSGAENLCANISEGIDDTQYSYLNTLTSYRADSPLIDNQFKSRTLLASAHRYYFQFSSTELNILNGNTGPLHPVGTIPARTYGWLIPFNMAIVGVYGYGDGGVGAVGANVDIELHLHDQAGVALDAATVPGITAMPMFTSSVPGGWRWTANPLNFNIPTGGNDLHTIPLIYLPVDYSSSDWNVNTGTVTIATNATGLGGTITVTIDGVVVTHPTGVGDTPTVSAAAMSAAINATPALVGLVQAIPAGPVITITAFQPGLITLAAGETDATQTCVAGSSSLDPTPVPYAGDMWLLSCTAHNNSGGDILLTTNITVEAVLLPTHSVAD